jgi:heme o synthase
MLPGTASQSLSFPVFLMTRVKSYLELLKMRLSFLVAFSSGFGYLLASGSDFSWMSLAAFSFGGFLISGSAITINQILEREYDRIMKRTSGRPLPTGRVSTADAARYAVILAVAGLIIVLSVANLLTALLSLLSLVLYSFVYTPLKRVGPVAVLVGAVPGALPPLIGWTAATGQISAEALIIFGLQFVWQFPHFWAIAWLADEDYRKAGFKLLPAHGKLDLQTATSIMLYTIPLVPLGLLPMAFGITGAVSAAIATVAGLAFLYQTLILMRDASRRSALRIMYGSFLYLPIVQIAFLVDRL